jgi:hypothetical protein
METMIKPVLISIIPASFITATWLLGSKELIPYSESVGLFLFGVILIGLGTLGRKRYK